MWRSDCITLQSQPCSQCHSTFKGNSYREQIWWIVTAISLASPSTNHGPQYIYLLDDSACRFLNFRSLTMVVCSAHDCETEVNVSRWEEINAIYFFFPKHTKPCRVQECNTTRAHRTGLQQNFPKYCDAHVCQYPDCCNIRISTDNGTRYCSDHECRHENCTRIGVIRDHCVEHKKLLCTVRDCDGIAVLSDVPMHWSCAPDCDGDEDCMAHPRYRFCSAHTCRVDGCARDEFF